MSLLDGHDHTVRRRAFNRAFRKEALEWYMDNVTLPQVKHQLALVLAHPDPDGVSRADLVVLMHRTLMTFAASLIGLNGAKDTSDEDINDLLRVYPPLITLMGQKFVNSSPDELLEVVERALAAKQEYMVRLYDPALAAAEARRALEKPDNPDRYDLITIIADRVDPSHEDHDLGVRDAISILGAVVDTSNQLTVTAVWELAKWFKAHPEDYPLRTDINFLAGAVAETIRCNGPGAAASPTHDLGFVLSRIALEDFTLSTGGTIKAGQWIAIELRKAGLDESVFGADARDFNLRRQIPPDVPAYGIGFGAGVHQCIGLPVIMGTGETHGTAEVVKALYDAGLQPDPERPPRWSEVMPLKWESFPVTFSSAH
jgi:cytochrome P450